MSSSPETTTVEQTTNSSLEDAFRLIQEGKDFVTVDASWEAADAFSQAQCILNDLAAVEAAKDEKIAALYKQQSREYLHQARTALITALQQEHETDQGSSDEEPFYLDLSEEDATSRLRLFARLFSREMNLTTTPEQQDANALEQQSSLEDRLTQLNASLPSGFKTSNERMQNINRGLNRLGLSLYSAADENKSSVVEPEKSDTDQVADIIQQAKDEISMQPATEATGVTPNGDSGIGGIDEDALLLMNEEDDDDDGSDADSDDLRNEMDIDDAHAIRDKVVDAQAKLAEIVALLDVDDQDTDGVGHVTISNQGPAKKALRSARILLQQATRQWTEAS